MGITVRLNLDMKMLGVVFLTFLSAISVFSFQSPVWAASVIMKMQVENPSKTEEQTVPVKVYLPKEVSPKDLLDLGDLKLDYDPETGMYYVHTSIDLQPGQSMVKQVEMSDVWVFTEEQLNSFVNQAKQIATELANTPYAAEASALVLGIEEKVQGILKRQEETADQPSEHIRAYRQGISLINTIREDVNELERLQLDTSSGKGPEKKDALAGTGDADSRLALLESGGVSEGGAPLGRSISMTAAWRIIFAILAFLGVLSAVFFMTWHSLVSKQQMMPLEGLEEMENHPEVESLDARETQEDSNTRKVDV